MKSHKLFSYKIIYMEKTAKVNYKNMHDCMLNTVMIIIWIATQNQENQNFCRIID